jgi:hypothetical protein
MSRNHLGKRIAIAALAIGVWSAALLAMGGGPASGVGKSTPTPKAKSSVSRSTPAPMIKP